MPKLLLKFDSAVIKEIPLKRDAYSIGRKPDNDIIIDHPAISSHHCRVSLQGGVYVVEDLESTNGTFVNQKRIKKSGLHHNDMIGLAKHSLVFIDEAQIQAAAKTSTQEVPIPPEPGQPPASAPPKKQSRKYATK